LVGGENLACCGPGVNLGFPVGDDHAVRSALSNFILPGKLADAILDALKFIANYRPDLFPGLFGPFLAFPHDLFDPLLLWWRQLQTFFHAAQEVVTLEIRWSFCRERLGLQAFCGQATGNHAGNEDYQRRQNDLPRFHQESPALSNEARTVFSNATARGSPVAFESAAK
jgi:hypothetical protein